MVSSRWLTLACLLLIGAAVRGGAQGPSGNVSASGGSYNISTPLLEAGNGTVTANLTTNNATNDAVLGPEFGYDISPLLLSVDSSKSSTLRIKITDPVQDRWQVPTDLWMAPEDDMTVDTGKPIYNLTAARRPFSFAVHRVTASGQNAMPIFDTTGLPFVFKDQYIEINARLDPDSSLYGLGEQSRSFGMRIPRTNGSTGAGAPYTLWARDAAAAGNNTNLYGHWPMLMQVHPDGTADAVFLHNSNGMDIFIQEDIITYKVLGGIVDLYFFMGPTPADVLRQLTDLVGKPAIPPYWSLGFHQSKYGYANVYELQGVVANYSAANIPLEVMWTDIDYMEHFKAFTLDPVNYPMDQMVAFIDGLHAKGQKWVPIVDPAITAWTQDLASSSGLEQGVFLRDYMGQPYLGQVWPGVSYFPDFLNPATQSWWTAQFKRFYNELRIDGVWIDMNEPANFCFGETCALKTGGSFDNFTTLTNPPDVENYFCMNLICTSEPEQLPSFPPELASYVTPPYAIDNGNWQSQDEPFPLNYKTTGMTAMHYNGVKEYDAKNIYGLSMAKVTYNTMLDMVPGRPFILSRSTFPGAGAYAAHWTGDNAATWEDLRWSVSTMLTTGLMGIPNIGADICGFIGNTTEQLCNRWISAGAFYPFSRDHSMDSTGIIGKNATNVEQELYRWQSVADAGRTALNKRYQLLTYMYTTFADSRLHGCPVARPLWFSYPADAAAQAVDEQWLLGDGVLVSPVLQENATSVDAYIPQGLWYDMWDYSKTVDRRSGGANATISNITMDGKTPLHVRGGTILPLQQSALLTETVRTSGLQLLVALPQAADATQAPATATAAGRKMLQQPAAADATPADASAAYTGCALPAKCGVASNGLATACGQMLFDVNGTHRFTNNEDLKSHMATLSATVNHTGNASTGVVLISFGSQQYFTRGASTASACPATQQFPALNEVLVLGLKQQAAPTQVSLQVGMAAAQPVAAANVAYDAAAGTLMLKGLGQALSCPDGVVISWS